MTTHWIAALLATTAQPTLPAEASGPVRLIFDTDLGNDVDDTMALAMIHALKSRGECELLAVTITKDNRHAAPFVDLFNTFYGRGNVPIGVVRGGKTPEDFKYIRQVAAMVDGGKARYPHDLKSGLDAPEATTLLRRILAGEPDGSVVVVMVGFSTNMARLLDSKPDAISPLDGKSLVRRKVRLLSAMAGGYSAKLSAEKCKEYNVVMDAPSAQKVFHEWPTPIVASGFEIGEAILYPGRSIRDDYRYGKHHPLVDAYDLYRGRRNDQPTWDLTSVLYAVRPDRGYFNLSPPGRIEVQADGFAGFAADRKGATPSGNARFLIAGPLQIAQVREALVMLCSQPPDAAAGR
jgi:purine nucleosidase